MALSAFRRTNAAGAGLALLAACGGGGSIGTNPPPANPPPQNDEFVLQPVFDPLTFAAPVVLLQAPGDDTRWFVVEQAGVIRVFDNQAGVANSGVFADISARVDDSRNESGLLGMAFHPDFLQNGEVYLSYTRTGTPLESVISRFLVDAGGLTLDEASEEILVTVPQPNVNHNGGNIAFGQDRLLYIGFGDGGGAGDPGENAQNTNNILGSIVRIDVNGVSPYVIPGGNPMSNNTECVGGMGAAFCPEIFAWGFRNPWRFSFDRQTGALWVGDVGQNSWEEIDRVTVGLNYGWNDREGAHCFDPPAGCSTANVDPITEYDHNLGRSVTGGYVYRGSALPGLVGHYLFADFGTGRLFSVPANSVQGTVAEERLDTNLNISSFGQDADGELYLLDYGSGTIHQIVPTP